MNIRNSEAICKDESKEGLKKKSNYLMPVTLGNSGGAIPMAFVSIFLHYCNGAALLLTQHISLHYKLW